MARFNLAHCSMQFSDSPSQKKHDAEALVERALERDWRWATGTEAGPGDDRVLANLLDENFSKAGYRFFVPQSPTDGWIVVRKTMIDDNWSQNYEMVIPSSGKTGSSKKHAPKGVISVGFDNKKFGRIEIGTSHYLTGGRVKGKESVYGKSDHYEWNSKLAERLDVWARKAGRGENLAWYGGDQNIPDNKYDTFRGGVLLSAGDELGKHPNTGHGPIDVIARNRRDARSKAVYLRSYTDKQFFMYSDHRLLEAGYAVEPLDPQVIEEPEHHACPDCGRVHIIA